MSNKTLAGLRNVVGAYHTVSSNADFTANSIDLLLFAVNNAQTEAQMLHNFEDCRCTALLTIDAVVGGDLSDATFENGAGDRFSSIREVLAVTRQRPDGTYIPLDFARADIPIERDRTELEFSDNLFPYLRYPSDAQINARGTNSSIIQRGTNLSIYPVYTMGVTTPFATRLECFGWLKELTSDNYNDTDPSNFLLDYGFTWLQWYCICELNHLFKSFTARVEGNIAPPERMRDEAWRRLVQFDDFRVDSNTTRSR